MPDQRLHSMKREEVATLLGENATIKKELEKLAYSLT